MPRICPLTGKRPLIGNLVSHANNKTRMRQLPNLQWKRLWVPELGQFLRIRLSTRALRSIAKLGFLPYCAKQGILVSTIGNDSVIA
ncbi:MAG: 50S ribosomal protein L28 [Myxococcales bacterium]|nr:50S ribosomal protein L28 [Myxococcales bacterium]